MITVKSVTYNVGKRDLRFFWLCIGAESPLNIGFLLIICRCLLASGPIKFKKKKHIILVRLKQNVNEIIEVFTHQFSDLKELVYV